ncbi:hypothetical protein EXN22_17755 [Pseudomonas tructae]|uniref:Uncharacterized protein n=1 Tax=Pseudomonas tructae TaxID=2518644 RepID=A0A411MKW4_9PSED|nr:hypothetical protein [Pseudomonas tructae]QBF27439.1 hypothetical protein EXN22_17755 [Pseudomonas tructae]
MSNLKDSMGEAPSAVYCIEGDDKQRALVAHHRAYLKTQRSNQERGIGFGGFDLASLFLGIGSNLQTIFSTIRSRREEGERQQLNPLVLRVNNFTGSPLVIASISGVYSHNLENLLISPSGQGSITLNFPFTKASGVVEGVARMAVCTAIDDCFLKLELGIKSKLTFGKNLENVQGYLGLGEVTLIGTSGSPVYTELKGWDSKGIKVYATEPIDGSPRAPGRIPIGPGFPRPKSLTIVTSASCDFGGSVTISFYNSYLDEVWPWPSSVK